MKNFFSNLGGIPWLSIIVGLVLAVLLPLVVLKAGVVKLLPAGTITVTGEAETEITTQIASFTAGVTAINDDRDTAISEVNTKIFAIIEAVKQFGVPEEDIQTQNLSAYQMEEPIDVDGRQRTTPGQWRVSNDIQVKLSEINKSSELAELLTKSGATNVYGPNFSLENVDEAEMDLLTKAVEDARQKAQALATSQDKRIGEIVNIQEGLGGGMMPYMDSKVMMGAGGGGGVPIAPGTSQVSKSVTVTFRLK